MNLAQKLVAAALDVGTVVKAGRNPEEGYAFARVEDVVTAARAALLSRGVLIVPSVTHSSVERTPEDAQRYCRTSVIDIEYRILDSESSDEIKIAWAAQAMDTSDKGFSKCYTAALKYVLINLLLIPLGEDVEADGAVDRHVKPRRGRTDAEVRASVERPGVTHGPSPAPPLDPRAEAERLYSVRCARLGLSGRGSGAPRAKIIRELFGAPIHRANLSLAQLNELNEHLARLRDGTAGAQRMDSPGDSATTAVEPAPVASEPLYSAVEDGDDSGYIEGVEVASTAPPVEPEPAPEPSQAIEEAAATEPTRSELVDDAIAKVNGHAEPVAEPVDGANWDWSDAR